MAAKLQSYGLFAKIIKSEQVYLAEKKVEGWPYKDCYNYKEKWWVWCKDVCTFVGGDGDGGVKQKSREKQRKHTQ